MKLDTLLEAILFYKSEPVTVDWLSKVTKKSVDEINLALETLAQKLSDRGVVLVRSDSEIKLGTHPEAAGALETITKEELSGELGKAGMETLTIILYKSPVSRSVIEYIRGVNSQFTLRHLMIRGLIERTQNPDDSRSFLYQPSLQALAFMGLGSKEDLPEYSQIRDRLAELENKHEQETTNSDNL